MTEDTSINPKPLILKSLSAERWEAINRVIEAAVEREREACAKIAANYCDLPSKCVTSAPPHAICNAALIARLIRARGKRQEVSFADCKNPECPVGCPDSHCLPFGEEEKL